MTGEGSTLLWRQGETEQGIIEEAQVIASTAASWNHQDSGWIEGKPKRNALLCEDTQELRPASHAEVTGTFIAPLLIRDLLLLLVISVGWSSVYSLSRTSQTYTNLFLQ